MIFGTSDEPIILFHNMSEAYVMTIWAYVSPRLPYFWAFRTKSTTGSSSSAYRYQIALWTKFQLVWTLTTDTSKKVVLASVNLWTTMVSFPHDGSAPFSLDATYGGDQVYRSQIVCRRCQFGGCDIKIVDCGCFLHSVSVLMLGNDSWELFQML